jgi:hypothetical protein
MPSNGTAQSFTDIDFGAAVCLPYFGGNYLGPLSRVTELWLQSGEPSYALCFIPMDTLDRLAPSVCGISGSILDQVKHVGQLVQIKGSLTSSGSSSSAQTILMNGRPVDINQELYPDKAVIRVEDDRTLMRGVALPGSFWLSGDPNGGSAGFNYRQGWPAHFNPGSRPNGIWVSAGTGKVPVFCHPFFGLKDGEPVPDSTAQSTTQACYWTPQMQFIYLQYFTSDEGLSSFREFFPWLSILPSSITWPSGLESFIVDTTGLPQRKGRESTLEGNLFAALRQILQSAGPFDIYLDPNSDGSSTLAIVRTKYIGSNQSSGVSTSSNNSAIAGVSLQRAARGKAQDVLTLPGVINAGSIRENSQNTVTRCAVAGHISTGEMRLKSAIDPMDKSVGILQGWSVGDLAAFKNYILNGDGSSYLGINGAKTAFTTLAEAFTFALRAYWRVFKTYNINPEFDIQQNTDQESKFPLCKTTRAPLPHILALYLQDNAATSGNLLANLSTRREIPLEVDNFNYSGGAMPDDKNFSPLPINHGIQIAPDGTLDLSGLVEQVQSSPSTIINSNGLFTIAPAFNSVTKLFNFDDPSTFKISRIRVTLAVPFDNRVVGAVKLAGDPTATPAVTGLPVDDSARIDFSQSKLAYVNALGLLAKEQRATGSTLGWPIPESVGGVNAPGTAPAAGMPDFKTGVLRDDTPEAINQATRKLYDIGKLDRTTLLSSNKIALTYVPGMMMDTLTNVGIGGTYDLRSCIQKVAFMFEEKPQRLVIHGI